MKNYRQQDFADLIGTTVSMANKLLHGKEPVTWPLADRLEFIFGGRAHQYKTIGPEGIKELYGKKLLIQHIRIFFGMGDTTASIDDLMHKRDSVEAKERGWLYE